MQYTTHVVTHSGAEGAVGVPRRRGARRQDHQAVRVSRLRQVQDRRRSRHDEYEIRELCEAFFDAYENRRVDDLDRLYADDCIIWHNVFGKRDDARREPRRASRRLQGPAPPHVQRPHHQHVPRRLRHPVHAERRAAQRPPGALWICIVGRCRDGKITRIDEYMDSASSRRGPAGGASDEEGLADARAVRSVLRLDRAERLRNARVVLRARGGHLAQPRLPVPAARRQPRDAEAGHEDAAEGAVQGPPHPRVRGRLRAAAHDLRDARRTASSARWTCASSATSATA